MADHDVSLGCTTYQTGKLLLIGRKPDGQFDVHERTHQRDGPWGDGQTLWMGTEFQLWKLCNVLRAGEQYLGHDRLYVPKVGETTGDLDVTTLPSSRAAGLRGDALRLPGHDGGPRHLHAAVEAPVRGPARARGPMPPQRPGPGRGPLPVRLTAVSTSDVVDGWCDRRRDGGVVLEVPSGRVVASGLSMPHPPRVQDGRLWVLNSGAGFLGTVDRGAGRFDPLVFCPGYLRGLAFVGDYAVVGSRNPATTRPSAAWRWTRNSAGGGRMPAAASWSLTSGAVPSPSGSASTA